MEQVGSQAAPVIVCEGVSIGYGRTEVLCDVNLAVLRGQFLPFVGPNGAGKTTLLRGILGLLKPLRGKIVTPFDRCPPGYLPQQKSIDPVYPVTAWQIVAMGLYAHRGWRQSARVLKARAEAALDEFGLTPHAGKRFSELSGGMKQKVLLARAFAGGAEVFIMDEPTSELDEASERSVLDHLHRLSREQGKTVLLAHHGMDQIAERAADICFVDHGRAQLMGVEALWVLLKGEGTHLE